MIRYIKKQNRWITRTVAFCLCFIFVTHRSEADIRKKINFPDLNIPKKDLPFRELGINSFVNDPGFGSVKSQMHEVKNRLRIKHHRVLFAWITQVQPTPTSPINFSFMDDIVRSTPRGSDILITIAHVPNWMYDPNNWINGDPKKTFVDKIVTPLITRYRSSRVVTGYQIWNEPNMKENPDNVLLGFDQSPEKYVEMLKLAYEKIKVINNGKKVVSAATTAINQNYPRSLNYNKSMLTAGALNYTDIWGLHYYGSNYYNLYLPGGIKDFTDQITKPIWVTESGAKGANKQEDYTRRTFPLLNSEIRNINRFYYYQFTERGDPNTSYGLKSGAKVSDLYLYLQNRR